MSGEMKYPRVLVINGEPFSVTSATGITMSNLFRGWPIDRLAQIYTAGIAADDSVCSQSWRLSSRNLYGISLVDGFLPRFLANEPRFPASAVGQKTAQKNALSQIWLRLRRFASILDFLPYRIPKDMRQDIINFKPDVIYSLLGNIRIVRLVNHLSSELDVPVIPHFMDDWLSTYSLAARSAVSSLGRTILPRLTRRLLGRAALGLAISEDMCEEYADSFEIPFRSFMNPVEVVAVPAADRWLLSHERLRLVYVGGLHLGRDTNLVAIADAVQELRRGSVNVELHIYVPEADVDFAASIFGSIDGTILKGSVAPQCVGIILRNYDVAVHVESFLPRFAKYTRLSISTKIPQYFAAGLPVFACGPNDVASCRYVENNNCGCVVSDLDVGKLQNELRCIIEDSVLRKTWSEQAVMIAAKKHSAESVRLRFKQAMVDALEKKRWKESIDARAGL